VKRRLLTILSTLTLLPFVLVCVLWVRTFGRLESLAYRELSHSAKEKLERIATERGMTQFAMLSRLAEWFAEQDPKTQHVALARYPRQVMRELAKTVEETRALQNGK
jgi:hypothetical protein